MAILAEMADIFSEDLPAIWSKGLRQKPQAMTLDEMMVLETFLIDTIDLALSTGESAFALEAEDALIDLNDLKRSRMPAGNALTFWERQLSSTGTGVSL